MVYKPYIGKLGLTYTLLSIRINWSLDKMVSFFTFLLIVLAGSFYLHYFWMNYINGQRAWLRHMHNRAKLERNCLTCEIFWKYRNVPFLCHYETKKFQSISGEEVYVVKAFIQSAREKHLSLFSHSPADQTGTNKHSSGVCLPNLINNSALSFLLFTFYPKLYFSVMWLDFGKSVYSDQILFLWQICSLGQPGIDTTFKCG